MGVSRHRGGTTTPPRPSHGPWRASIAAVTATTCGMLGAFLTSALAPLLRADADVTPAHLGVAVAVFFGVSGMVAPLGGRLADRVGSVRVMRMSLILAAGALAGVGLAVHGSVGLVVGLGVAGVSNGAIQPSANRYLSRLIPPQRQGLAFGVKQAAIPAAILLGGLSVPAAAYITGWRAVYLAGAVLAGTVALLIRRPSLPRQGPAEGAGRAVTTPLPRRSLLVLAAGWALASAGANALGAFFVLGAVHAGISTVHAGLMVVLGSLASITVRIGSGFLADGWTGNGFGVVAAMSAIGAAGVGLLTSGSPWAFVLATVIGYGIGWGWAGLFNYAVVRTDPAQPGKTTGVTQAGAGAGACAGPLAFGALVTHAGYPIAWLAAAATLLVASGVIMAGRTMLPRSAPPAAETVRISEA